MIAVAVLAGKALCQVDRDGRHGRRDLTGIGARVEFGNRARAADAAAHLIPEYGAADPKRGNDTNTSNRDAIGHRTSKP